MLSILYSLLSFKIGIANHGHLKYTINTMRPFYCRIGSKRKVADALIQMFPVHETYVEPFFGGGAVFWAKEPSHVEILNDLDHVLIEDYNLIRTAPPFSPKYPVLTSIPAQTRLMHKPHKTKQEAIVAALYRRCNGFGGRYTTDKIYRDTSHESKLENIAEYKARLRDAALTELPYERVIRKYDGNDSFFFLDPPYENSGGLGYAKGSESFDFEELARILSHIRGKFLLTINDSPYIREVFNDFHIFPYIIRGHHSPRGNIGKQDRPELIITNYKVPSRLLENLKVL